MAAMWLPDIELLNYPFKVIKQTFSFLLSALIALAPLESHAHALRLILETGLKDTDSTRLAVDFGEMTFDELGRLPEKLQQNSDILPGRSEPLIVHAFVPSDLDQAAKDEFAANVQEQLSRHHRKLTITVLTVDIDLEQAQRDHDEANLSLVDPSLVHANDEQLSSLQVWRGRFKESINNYKRWLKSGYTKDKDERVGGWIGKARGMASASVWFGFNHASWSTAFQIPASFFLDWFFSKYERKVDIFKATHRLPGENVPGLKYVVRFYNDRPLLKSWIIGNLIGFTANSYFRFWSWVEDPVRTSAPWSPDALATYTGLLSIGNLSAAFGAQGPRILRKKGYISSRSEYYLYTSYGAIFQVGGWLYGLGWNWPALALASGESLFKIGLYTAARFSPNKDPRAIVLHSGLNEKEATELLYRVGLEKSELKSFKKEDFDRVIRRLKRQPGCEEELNSEE